MLLRVLLLVLGTLVVSCVSRETDCSTEQTLSDHRGFYALTTDELAVRELKLIGEKLAIMNCLMEALVDVQWNQKNSFGHYRRKHCSGEEEEKEG